MSASPNQDYEVVEVTVSKKIDIRLSLDDLIKAVAQHASELTTSTQAVPPQVTDRLNQLTQLAQQLESDVSQLGAPKPPTG